MHGIELLEKGIHELNLEISETQKKQFEEYYEFNCHYRFRWSND